MIGDGLLIGQILSGMKMLHYIDKKRDDWEEQFKLIKKDLIKLFILRNFIFLILFTSQQKSNLQPLPYHGSALPIELCGPSFSGYIEFYILSVINYKAF